VYPADGARTVPTNARVWIFGQDQNAYVLSDGTHEHIVGHSVWSTPRMQMLDLGVLASQHSYTVLTITGEHVTTFTTGDEPKSTPPNPPTLQRVRWEPGKLHVSARADENVAVWVRTWHFGDEHVPWAWQLFPADGFDAAFETCSQLDARVPGAECVEIRAVDISYKTSAIVSNCTLLPPDPSWIRPTRRSRTRYVIPTVVIAFGVLAGIVVMLGLRRRPADPITP
jgi:hypothetical protein